MLSGASSSSVKSKKKLEPTIKKPEIAGKKSKSTSERQDTLIKLHEPLLKPHEPTSNKSNLRIKSPRQKIKRSYDKYIIDLKNYEIINTTSGGVIGITNFIRNKKTNIRYTSKTSPTPSNTQNPQLILREISLLIRVHHPTIIQIQGFSYEDFQGSNNVTILMNFVENGSLSDLIQKVNLSLFPTNYDNTKRQIILVGIARGMMILHERHIVHRDLKPENILIESEFKPKITNFGLSKIFNSEEKLVTQIGSISYMAPEVFTSNRFSAKADVYSFGILMFELISNTRVYRSTFESNTFNFSEFQEKVVNGMRPEFTFPIKGGIKKIIEACWAQNPADRPTFSELFCKLSLSDEEGFLDSDQEKVIKTEDKMSYCLNDVNLDELFSYVDEILDDQKGSQNSQEEIEQLMNMNSELMKSVNEQKSRISYLTKYISSLKDDNSKLKEENLQLNRVNEKLETENAILKSGSTVTSCSFERAANPMTRSLIQKNEPIQQSNQNSMPTNFSIQTDQQNSQPKNENDQINTENFQLTTMSDHSNRENSHKIDTNDQINKENPDSSNNQIQTSCEKERSININDQINNENSPNTSNGQIEARDEKEQLINNDQINKENSPNTNDHFQTNSIIHPTNETHDNNDSNDQLPPEKLCQKIANEVREGKVTVANLPGSLHTVPDGLFKFCRVLSEVRIPSSATSIGSYAFYDCSMLSKIELPSTTTRIGDYSFCLCSLLSSITIPQSVTFIGSHAFSRCSSLTVIELPTTIETVGSSCFSWCTSLKSMKIPSSLNRVEDCCFFGCCSLVKVDLNDSIKTIGCDAFYRCCSLQKVSIPSSVVSVGKGAFNGCLSLDEVVFNVMNSVLERIGDYSFFECSSLVNVEFPSSVKAVGLLAFGECGSLLSAKIPSSVDSIENNSFPSETKIIKS